MIHVCFCLHDKTGHYSKFTGTTMLSIFENHTPPHIPSITVHILHDNTLTIDNREKFSYLAGQYKQAVKFYNVEELCSEKIKKMIELVPAVKNSRVSVGAFFKFLIPEVLPENIQKVIYLDSDTIVNLDISELWQIELGDKPLASVPESKASFIIFNAVAHSNYLIKSNLVKQEDYFNSGILFMNLNYLRKSENLIMNGVKWRGEHTKCWSFDQAVFNYLFSDNYLKLPDRFDQFADDERKLKRNFEVRHVIYHFAGTDRGIGITLNMNDLLDRLWMSYFIKTPWFDENTIGRLYSSVQELHVGLKQSMIQISAIMSGKTRAFFVAPENIDAVKEIFSIRKDEEIIRAESEASLKKLINTMKKSRGKKVFFIMLSTFPFQTLIDAGFEPGKDFVNGVEFLSEAHGVPMNSFPFVQAM